MALFRRRPRQPTQAPRAGPADLSVAEPPAGVPVLLSAGLADLALPLHPLLSPEFSIQTEGDGVDGVMIVGPVGAAGVSFLRAEHPRVILLVVDRPGRGRQPDDAVAHLEAGADGYLSGPPVAEVASHVRALTRRARPAAA